MDNNEQQSIQPQTTPLLLLNDVERRKRKKAKLRNHHNHSNNNHQQKLPKKKKSWIKNNEFIQDNDLKTNDDHDQDEDIKDIENKDNNKNNKPHHEVTLSQKDMEDNLAKLYINDAKMNLKKSKSHQYLITTNNNINKRLYSRSGPPLRKKRTFKLSEPKELTAKHSSSHSSSSSINMKINISNNNNNNNNNNNHRHNNKQKKKSRNFMKEYNRNTLSDSMYNIATTGTRSRSYSPTGTTGTASLETSHSTPSPPHSSSIQSSYKKKRNSFKLGDDSALVLFRSHDSFDSYKTKYKVHKPKIQKGSNQFLVSQKMRELQAKLKDEEEKELKKEEAVNNINIDNIDSLTMNEINESFGKSLDLLKTIKLPNYDGSIPKILIELKKKLHSCDGLKQRKIFHNSVKNNTSTHHQIAHLIHNFFNLLPSRLLDNISISYFTKIISYKQIPDIILKIPNPNKSILLWLWDLLSDTIEYSISNKMTIESLSKSMAPNMITNNQNNKIMIKFFKYGIEWRLFLRQQK